MTNFIISFFCSFAGSLTPGTINLSVLQSGLDGKARTGIRLAIAAACVEYVYAWAAVSFEKAITSSARITSNFHLIGALVILTLGLITLASVRKPTAITQKFNNSGIRRGLALGILNPLAMPYWIGVTAYLKSQGWIELSTPPRLHLYLAGVSFGVFTLLTTVALLSAKVIVLVNHNALLLKRLPGYLMVLLGTIGLISYFLK